MTGPDFAEQARRAYERDNCLWPDCRFHCGSPCPRDEPCAHCDEANSFTCCAGWREPLAPSNKSLVLVTLFLVTLALVVVAFATSQPCDFEFWGGLKVGLGAVC